MSVRIDSSLVQEAIKEGRVEYIGKRRGHPGYPGVVSRQWQAKGEWWFEIDINCIGGVPAPLAKRGKNPLAGFINRLRPGG